MTTQEERWKVAERSLDVQTARRVRRTPGVVIGIIGLLVLAVGVTAAVDLRRLQTPRGAALAWTEAATFGDCRAFLSLSTADVGDRRTDDDVCRTLRAATATARSEASRTRVIARSVRQQGRSAVAVMAVQVPAGTTVGTLRLVRRGHAWRVLRGPCDDLSCY